MKGKTMKKNSIIYSGAIVILLIIIGFLVYKNQMVNKNKFNTESIYCTYGKNEDKIELYIDFKDGKAYRYTHVLTNKMDSNFNLSGYQESFDMENQKYKGVVAKIWNDDNIRVITEVFDLNILSEKEMQDLTAISIKELQSKTRAEIIEQFADYDCK